MPNSTNTNCRNINDVFNLNRLLLFIRLDLAVNYKMILVFMAATASVLFLYCIALPVHSSAENFHVVMYSLVLFNGGFWVSSLAFKDVHDDKRNYLFLTLPVSNFEKFFGKLLLTSVGYVVVLSLFYFVLSVIVAGINALLFKYPQPFFNVLDPIVLSYIKWYLVWQSVFVLGSIYFAKHAMSKITLTASLVVIVFIIVAFLFSVLFVGPQAFFTFGWNDPLLRIIKTVFLIFVAPFCWLLTYLRLTETEL